MLSSMGSKQWEVHTYSCRVGGESHGRSILNLVEKVVEAMGGPYEIWSSRGGNNGRSILNLVKYGAEAM